jgi:hypothetical protein
MTVSRTYMTPASGARLVAGLFGVGARLSAVGFYWLARCLPP